MQCKSCNGPIDQGRIDWCNSKGFPCKYCKECSDARKAAKSTQNFQKQHEPDWDRISFGKISHGFLVEAYKIEKSKGSQLDPEVIKKAKNDAYLWTMAELDVQDMIAQKKSSNS